MEFVYVFGHLLVISIPMLDRVAIAKDTNVHEAYLLQSS